jgi:hypothetical protein
LVLLEHKTLTRRRSASIARLVVSGGRVPQPAGDSSRPADALLRHALIIGTSQHRWRPFSRLASPTLDLQGLHAALTAPEIGGFEAPAPLRDQPAFHLAMELESFFRDRDRDELLLLYVAGHVLLDERGAPFLITHATDRGRWRSSVIDFSFLRDVMAQSSSERQVILLDCALGSLGANAPPLGAHVDIEAALSGPGRTVVSASNRIRYRLDDDAVSGDSNAAPWLRRIVHGLRTGEADLDGDGSISLDDLIEYAPGRDAPSEGTLPCGVREAGRERSSVVIARCARTQREPLGVAAARPVELRATAAHDPRMTTPRGAGAARSWTWASHAASSVAAWLVLRLRSNERARRYL